MSVDPNISATPLPGGPERTAHDAAATGSPTTRRRRRGSVHGTNWPLTILLMVCSLSVLLPFFVAVSMAFKTTDQAVLGQAFKLPAPWSLEGFREAWELTDFPKVFAISLTITVVSTVGAVLLSAMASYAISRNWNRRFFRISCYYLLAAMFLPFPVLALSQVKLSGYVHLANPVGVIVLHIMFSLSFNVLLFTAFIRSLPEELEESARMDGASTWRIFWTLMFPLMMPMAATVGIFTLLASWNDFMMPSMIIADPSLQTLPVVQKIFQTQFSNNYNIAFASYLLAIGPSVIAYAISQKWVMAGLTQGAVK
ncbi:carbohydrate ABC transporter permease [Rothia kristinae]|uniref:carbohydrate ABC transporter permease n=1 Tax=Rothia kristinae TaxID=37923 RepID=UPI0009E5F446|nr:carbohydrate ABC transporter permease [Rothia kristinae]